MQGRDRGEGQSLAMPCHALERDSTEQLYREHEAKRFYLNLARHNLIITAVEHLPLNGQ